MRRAAEPSCLAVFSVTLLLGMLGQTPRGAELGLESGPLLAAAAVVLAVWCLLVALGWRAGERGWRLALQLLLLPGVMLGGLWLAQTLGNHGLRASYYRNPSFGGEPFHSSLERSVQLDLIQERYHSFPQYDFSVRWIGFIRIPEPGEYWFVTRSDDGSDLFVDDEVVVHNWGGGPVKWAKADLEAGIHAFSVSYVQTGGPYDMMIYWVRPGAEREVLTGQSLYMERPGAMLVFAETVLVRWYLLLLAVLVPALLLFQVAVLRRRGELGTAFRKGAPPAVALLMGLVVSLVGAELVARTIHASRESGLDPEEQLRRSQEMELTGQLGPLLTIAGLVRPSPFEDVVYELKPGVSGTFRNKPLQTSSLGIRDGEYEVTKTEGVYRIVGLGDSIMFGWGVAEEDCYLSVLERRLNAAGGETRFEVLNLAVPGYNTALEAASFEHRAVPLQPDLALVNFISNDFNLPNFMQVSRGIWGLGQLRLPPMIAKGWNLLIGRRVDPLVGMDLKDRFGATAEEIAADESIPERFKPLVGVPGFQRAMERFGRVAKEHGIPLVQVAQAFPTQLPIVMEASEKAGFRFLNIAEAVSRHVEAHGITDDRNFRVDAEDSHPNEVAHEIAALVLERFLREQGLVPLPPLSPADAEPRGKLQAAPSQ